MRNSINKKIKMKEMVVAECTFLTNNQLLFVLINTIKYILIKFSSIFLVSIHI